MTPARDEKQARAARRQNVIDIGRGTGVVEWDADRARHADGHVERQVARAVRPGDGHAIARGDAEKHNAILIKELERLSRSVDCIVMVQLSMSALAPLLTSTRVPVYNSGDTGLARVREMLLAMP